MANKDVVQQMKDLLKKSDDVREKFKASKEKAIADVERLETEIQELENQEKEIYSMFAMDLVEYSAYEQIKTDGDKKRKEKAIIQQKIDSVAELEKEELEKIFREYESTLEHDYRQFRQAEYNKSVKQLKKAKDAFLQEVVNISKHNSKIEYYQNAMHDIEVDAGLRPYNYSAMHRDNPFINGIGLYISDNDSVDIGTGELFRVYENKSTRPRW